MRKLFVLASLVIAAAASATERNIDQLKAIAADKLTEMRYQAAKQFSDAAMTTTPVEVYSITDGVAVLGNKGGFVVIATDDSRDAVLGYSDTEYSIAAANPALQEWMDEARMNMARPNARAASVPQGLPSEVAPFITTLWNQTNPYNLKCPSYVSNGKELHYPTGCVATAMAQVMNFYKYPAVGTGKKKFNFNPQDGRGPQIVSVDLADMPFDWDNMLDMYGVGTTEEQNNAVATLMFACGTSVEMEYTASGSGAQMYDACLALRNNFGYNPWLPFYYYQAMSTEEAMYIACSHLAQQHPLLIGANNPSSGGHAYVIDGYNADGLMHINWGWGPAGGNGYFSLFNMNGYTNQKQLLPVYREATEYASLWGFMTGGIEVTRRDATHISFTSQDRPLNIDALPYSGALYIVATSYDNPEQTVQLAKQDLVSSSIKIYYYGTNTNINKGNITILNKGLTDGSYRVYLASKADNESAYRPVRTTDGFVNSYTMVVKDMKIESVTANEDNAWMAYPTAIQAVYADEATNSRGAYNLAGQRIDADTYKGVVIKNGKTIVNR